MHNTVFKGGNTTAHTSETENLSPEWTPPNVTLTQILVGGGLFYQEVHLGGDINRIPLREVTTSQFVPDPINDGQCLLVDDLCLEIVPADRTCGLRGGAFVGGLIDIDVLQHVRLFLTSTRVRIFGLCFPFGCCYK